MSKWDESQYIFQRMDRTGHIEYKSLSLFCFSISFFATNKIAQASQVEADEGGGK